MRPDLKDTFLKTFDDMEHYGIYWVELRLPRQSGATYGLVRAAYQLRGDGKNVFVAFHSLRFANYALKDVPYSEKPIKAIAVSALGDRLFDEKAHLGDDVTYVFIDNLQFASISHNDLERFKRLVSLGAGSIRVLVVNTGISLP